MSKAYMFPGQGAQFSGMGKELYDNNQTAKYLFEEANELLGYRITDVMFTGSEEDLLQTNITQPAIFLHSVIAFKTLVSQKPTMVAGHSLGEFSALVANQSISFKDALLLVQTRANAMQEACKQMPSTMAAVLGLSDELVEKTCLSVQEETGEIVVTANYNCTGQLVISGTFEGVSLAIEKLKNIGAKRAVKLSVSGAFHSPLMLPAKRELELFINKTTFSTPICPIYQNVNAKAVSQPDEIKTNLINQLTSPVKWTQSVLAMVNDGAKSFTEVGPGKVLQGLVRKIVGNVSLESIS